MAEDDDRPLRAVDPSLLDRRQFIAGVGAATLLTAAGMPFPLSAAEPIEFGDFEITPLSDGHLMLPARLFAPQAEESARAAAFAAAGHSGDQIRRPLNVTLIRKGDEQILVDVGSGPRFMQTAGKLIDDIDANGIDREAITTVVFTHAHPDHIWGTTDDFDELLFPNARYLISEAEYNYWMADDIMAKLPEDRRGFATGAQRNINAVKDRLETFKPGADIVTGVTTLETGGHTPGHISLEVSHGSDTFVIVGDALTHHVVSFQYPDWVSGNDHEPEQAIKTRQKLLDKLASENTRLIGYHLPDPGVGRVERDGNAYRYVAET
jgi:glyoxylase-like metal-dependent hydrolase (beta-lactamase superfamily II)